jgi:hypothetical protein
MSPCAGFLFPGGILSGDSRLSVVCSQGGSVGWSFGGKETVLSFSIYIYEICTCVNVLITLVKQESGNPRVFGIRELFVGEKRKDYKIEAWNETRLRHRLIVRESQLRLSEASLANATGEEQCQNQR